MTSIVAFSFKPAGSTATAATPSKFTFGTTATPAAAGTTATPTAAATPKSTFSFGAAATPTNSAAATTGASTAAATAAATPTTGLFGKSSFLSTPLGAPGSATAQQQPTQQQQQQQQQQAPLTEKSKFSELPATTQQSFAQHQNVLTTMTKLSDDLTHRDTAPILDVRERIALLSEKLATVKSTLACDRQAVAACKSDADALLRAAEDAARLADRLKANNYTTDYSVQTPSPFFWQLLDQCEARMQQYTQHIDELSRFLAGSADYRQFSPQMLRDIMQHQYELFTALASSVAAVHEVVNARKEAFLRARRRAMPRESARDPNPFDRVRRPTIDFFQPTAAQARELALETRAQLSEAAAAQAAANPAAAASVAAAAATPGFSFSTAATPAAGAAAKPLFGATPATPAATGGLFGGFGSTVKPATTPAATAATGTSQFSFGAKPATTTTFKFGANK